MLTSFLAHFETFFFFPKYKIYEYPMKHYTRKLIFETDLLSREKDDDAIMTYFAFRISKLENFETLVVILKIFKIKFPV